MVIPTPSSSQVRIINISNAGHTLASQRGTFRFKLVCESARFHNRCLTSHCASVSHGHTAHHADPRKNTENTSPDHHRFQVNTVAMLRSGIGVPNRPAAIISRNRPTMTNFSDSNNQRLAASVRTPLPMTGSVARLSTAVRTRAGVGEYSVHINASEMKPMIMAPQ